MSTELVTDGGPAGPLPSDPVDALKHELSDLRRRLEVNDEEIDALQVEAARQHRRWHQDPTALTAVLAVVISVFSTVLAQVNLDSDRELQERNRLTGLIQQLPAVQQQAVENPGVTNQLRLIAGDAAALMAEIETSSFEKMQVAQALAAGFEVGRARDLVLQGLEQAQAPQEKLTANSILANFSFQIGDVAAGRAAYQRALDVLATPAENADSPLLRRYQAAFVEGAWAVDELTLARDCAAARSHQAAAGQISRELALPPGAPLETALAELEARMSTACG